MKPDLTDYDTLDVTALKKAEIPVGLCNGKVRTAMKQMLPRWDVAEFFLLQLKTAIKQNKIDYIVDDDRGRLQPEYFVHEDILSNWPELEYPPIPYYVAEYLKEREGQTIAPTPPTKLSANNSQAISKNLMLSIAVKALGFYDPRDTRKGKQADAVRFFQKQIEKQGLTGQYLSESTLKANLKEAMDALKQHAILDIKDDK